MQIKQFFALTGLTAIEALRQPICLLLVTTCVVFIALLPLMISHSLGEAERLVRDSALALHFFGGLLLGSYAACSSLTHEIRRGTAASVLSKPVGRATFFLAKYFGIAAVMLLFSAAASLATLISARAAAPWVGIDWWAAGPLLLAAPTAFALAGVQNYFTRRPFVSNAFALLLFALAVAFTVSGFLDAEGRWVRFGSAFACRVVPASVLITMAILVLSAIAVSLATRLDTVSTLSICSVVFMLGLMSDYLFGRRAADHRWAAVLYTILPDWQHFWAADALGGDGVIPWLYVAHAAGYAALYLAGILCLGILFFQHMEVRS